ncbi:MAG: hypothetical protein J7L45_01545 [Candidatus Aenigmarchaeota archaeon]|nr:hypothetical protein [Candidatus Aenigmarchaeota archaeon]
MRHQELICPECGKDTVRVEDDGRNILIRCTSCGFVIEDEIIVS